MYSSEWSNVQYSIAEVEQTTSTSTPCLNAAQEPLMVESHVGYSSNSMTSSTAISTFSMGAESCWFTDTALRCGVDQTGSPAVELYAERGFSQTVFYSQETTTSSLPPNHALFGGFTSLGESFADFANRTLDFLNNGGDQNIETLMLLSETAAIEPAVATLPITGNVVPALELVESEKSFEETDHGYPPQARPVLLPEDGKIESVVATPPITGNVVPALKLVESEKSFEETDHGYPPQARPVLLPEDGKIESVVATPPITARVDADFEGIEAEMETSLQATHHPYTPSAVATPSVSSRVYADLESVEPANETMAVETNLPSAPKILWNFLKRKWRGRQTIHSKS